MKIQVIGETYFVEKTSYPRIRVTADLRKSIPEILHIDLFERNCKPSEIAESLNRIGEYLNSLKKE
jgi:hypothetical protein